MTGRQFIGVLAVVLLFGALDSALHAQDPMSAEAFRTAMRDAREGEQVRLIEQLAKSGRPAAANWIAEHLDSKSYAVQRSIAGALKALTGWPYRSMAEWRLFWSRFGEGWMADPGRPTHAGRETWWDPVHRFALRRPARQWHFQDSAQGYTLHVAHTGSEQRQSWLLVDCELIGGSADAARRTAEYRKRKREEWEDYLLTAESVNASDRSESTLEIGGVEALVLKAVNVRKDNGEWSITWRLLVHEDSSINLFSTVPMGTPETDLDRMIGSFHFADAAETELPATLGHFKAELARADSAGRVKLLRRVAGSDLPYVPKGIEGCLGDPDPALQDAAIDAAGRLREPKHLALLLGLLKDLDADPTRLANLVSAIGRFGAPKARKRLLAVATSRIETEDGVFPAAVGALGRIPDRATLKDLVGLLDLVSPGSDASEEALIAALRELTGWEYDAAEEWRAFGKRQGRRWKPSDRRPPVAAIDRWEDPVHGFALKRPGDTWEFAPGTENTGTQVAMLRRKPLDAEAAWVRLTLADLPTDSDTPVEDFLDAWFMERRSRWKHIDEGTLLREAARLGKKDGISVSFHGTSPEGRSGSLAITVVESEGRAYSLIVWLEDGAPVEAAKETAEIQGSFRIGR